MGDMAASPALEMASQLVSGGVSGVLSTAVAHPIDRLKMMVIRDSAIDWGSLAANPAQLLDGLSGSLVEAFVYNGTNFGAMPCRPARSSA